MITITGMIPVRKGRRIVDIFDLCALLPEKNDDSGIILDNLIIARSKIENPNYRKIICTVSGGADSDIVVDICTKLDQDRKIDYVWFDTGLEYEATKRHIKELELKYGIEIEPYKADVPIPISCKRYGQPFISKKASGYIERLQKHGFQWEDGSFEELYARYPRCKAALRWWCNEWGEGSRFNIDHTEYLKEFMMLYPPESVGIRISPKCCDGAKKNVLHKIINERKYDLNISGIRKFEGGARATAYKGFFDEDEDTGCDNYRPIFWYMTGTKALYNRCFGITNSDCYGRYGLKRTGCAGCPFGQEFEEELNAMKKYEPILYTAVNNIFDKSYMYTRMFNDFRKAKKADELLKREAKT